MTVQLGAPVPTEPATEESGWTPLTPEGESDLRTFMESPTPITDLIAPKRRGRPPGSRNRPKDGEDAAPSAPRSVEPGEAAFGDELPRRPRGRPRKVDASVTPDQVADIVLLAHSTAAAFIGPAANISKDDAKKIGDAMVPVLQDWGIVVAGKVVHLVILFAAIGAVEIPVAMNVMVAAKLQAQAAREGTMTMSGAPGKPVEPKKGTNISAITGTEIGAPLTEA